MNVAKRSRRGQRVGEYPRAADVTGPAGRVAMPRLPRLRAPGETVHVVGRCNNREFCFTTPADYRTQWERLYVERGDGPFGQSRIDLSEVTVVPSLSPKTVVDMRALAAAQACREVALRFPGENPAGMLLVGPYRCALSLDRSPDAHDRGVLHLSVSHALGLGRLQRVEEAFLTGLYFTADERPGLAEEYGWTVPCMHVRYPVLAEA